MKTLPLPSPRVSIFGHFLWVGRMGLRIENIGTTYVSNYQRLAALWDGGASMVLQRTVEKRKRDFLRTMFLFETEKKKDYILSPYSSTWKCIVWIRKKNISLLKWNVFTRVTAVIYYKKTYLLVRNNTNLGRLNIGCKGDELQSLKLVDW